MSVWPTDARQKQSQSSTTPNHKWLKEGILWLLLLLPIGSYGIVTLQRSPREQINQQPLYKGIIYSRLIRQQPRPQIIHLFEIDLSADGLRPFVTPGIDPSRANDKGEIRHTLAQRTADFLQEHSLQLAVNANFFYPFEENAPWNYEPDPGDRTSIIGTSISEGERISWVHPRYSSLCFLEQKAQIVWQENCPPGTQQAVSGQPLWLEDTAPPEEMAFVVDKLLSDKAYPLTLAALNQKGDKLWLLVSDGKQPLYSEGTTIKDATVLLKELGAATALQLDGGGSSTAVIEQNDQPQVINAVIHAKVPGNDRPVANNLGFYALPLQP